jgi:putative endonuclease
MFYYTYVLQSFKDSNLYIGWTTNLKSRLNSHNQGLVKITKDRRPFRLVYYEACLDKALAIKREKTLKTGYGRKYLKQRINK